jgi:hypothetical protein
MLVAGTTGVVSVLNRASMGGLSSANAGAVQTFTAATLGCGTGPGFAGCYEIHSPALWNRTTGNSALYVWAQGDVLRMWDFNPSTNLFHADANQGTLTAEDYPGGGLAVSANGNSDGIVWAVVPTNGQGSGESGSQGQGILFAVGAENLGTQLWASTDYWFSTKFTIPTIGNGRVYVPTSALPASASPAYSPQLRAYGLCANCPQASPLAAGTQSRGGCRIAQRTKSEYGILPE